jgi:hypothetical protein
VTVLATTTAASLSLVKAMVTAPSLGSGAGVVMCTRPVDRVPPVTAVGFTAKSASAGVAVEKMNGLTVNLVDRETPPNVAVIVTSVDDATWKVVTPNEVAVWPAGTVTVEGTDAAALLVESVTTAPPLGATPFRITTPIEGRP